MSGGSVLLPRSDSTRLGSALEDPTEISDVDFVGGAGSNIISGTRVMSTLVHPRVERVDDEKPHDGGVFFTFTSNRPTRLQRLSIVDKTKNKKKRVLIIKRAQSGWTVGRRRSNPAAVRRKSLVHPNELRVDMGGRVRKVVG